jgi:hypothetical protein
MFLQATDFNQDLSDWDVSKGTGFVSDDQASQLFNLDAESLNECCVAFEAQMLSQPNHDFHYFSW